MDPLTVAFFLNGIVAMFSKYTSMKKWSLQKCSRRGNLQPNLILKTDIDLSYKNTVGLIFEKVHNFCTI